MLVTQISTFEELTKYQDRWNELAGEVVFRKWSWQSTWWQHYGEGKELFILLVAENEHGENQPKASQVQAILPCYLESTLARGKTLRLLGDGEVCSDHLDLIVSSERVAHEAAKALAAFLVGHDDQWDAIDFTAIASDCSGLFKLSDELELLDCQVQHLQNESRWGIALPEDWEAFLALQSKSHRKQLRRLERRVLETGQAIWHLVENAEQFEVAWPILVDLHQRRRISLGEPGCFASEQWAEFHRAIARKLLDSGELRLSWLEIAGQPVAAEYHFAGQGTTWAYQGGVDPERIEEEPGKLSMILALQHSMKEGHSSFDLMRGDEPYKAHWRAEPKETFDIQIVPSRSSAILRNQAFGVLQNAARLTRQVTNMLS